MLTGDCGYSALMSPIRPLRVVSVPTEHVYVRRVMPAKPAVMHVADPAPCAAGSWKPSPVLEPAWLAANREDFDVVHVHFGFEHRTREELQDFVRALRILRCPLILTVHDLENPHLNDQASHEAALDVLVSAATSIVTLTHGAAAEVSARWGRVPTVLPHPHVVDLPRIRLGRAPHAEFRFGVHDKRRANTNPDLVRPQVAAIAQELAGARLVAAPAHRLSDDELWDYLAALDALVLPYTFGTHSGFVEACFDLGTTVIVPRVGHFAEQRPVLTFDLGSYTSLHNAMRTAASGWHGGVASARGRQRERQDVQAAHARLYANAMLKGAQ
jgi:hypothetical protein